MKSWWIALLTLALGVLPGGLWAQDEKVPEKEPTGQAAETEDVAPARTPEQLFHDLEGEYRAEQAKWREQARAAAAEGKAIDMDSQPTPDAFAPRFMELARQHEGTYGADNAYCWILRNVDDDQLILEAFEALSKNPRPGSLAIAYENLGLKLSPVAEQVLRKAIKENDDHEAKGKANYSLARLLKRVDQMSTYLANEERVAQLTRYYGEARMAWLKSKDPEANRAELEKLWETIQQGFNDVRLGSGTLADVAERELFEIRNLAVGCVVPEIEAEDVDGVTFKISDYRGKVILLDFWGDW